MKDIRCADDDHSDSRKTGLMTTSRHRRCVETSVPGRKANDYRYIDR